MARRKTPRSPAPSSERMPLWAVVASTAAGVALLGGILFLYPVGAPRSVDASPGPSLLLGGAAVGLVVFALVYLFKSSGGLADRIGMFVLMFVGVVILYALEYFLQSRGAPRSFSSRLTRADALYFSVTAITTTGFGDISARSETARLLVSSEILVGLIFLGVGLGSIVSYLGESRHAGK